MTVHLRPPARCWRQARYGAPDGGGWPAPHGYRASPLAVAFARASPQSQLPSIVTENFLPFRNKGENGKDGWYSPGHGDVFPSLNDSGKLNILLAQEPTQ
ncbi:hypothetical protein BS78_10G146600 [Paspalum vaginatum]|nr:hypothetical protein BS78_10G146600 [Paspalum vaginatum]